MIFLLLYLYYGKVKITEKCRKKRNCRFRRQQLQRKLHTTCNTFIQNMITNIPFHLYAKISEILARSISNHVLHVLLRECLRENHAKQSRS